MTASTFQNDANLNEPFAGVSLETDAEDPDANSSVNCSVDGNEVLPYVHGVDTGFSSHTQLVSKALDANRVDDVVNPMADLGIWGVTDVEMVERRVVDDE